MQGERKAVTVLFADIKGSTGLIQHEDPEEAGLILQTVLRSMIEAVHRFDGVVSKIMGDGLMALFGAPLALEDHAVRGSYAALAMRQAVRDKAAELRRARGIEVQVRIGLNSGEVVVLGIGTDLHMDYDAVGATVHLAARMEQTAPPDRIRITSNTADLVGNSMQLDPLGPIPVSGFSEAVPVFELLDSVQPEFRAEPSTPSPLVNRAREMELLEDAARRVSNGRGQTVALMGAAGIGKSRLCLELKRKLRAAGWLCLIARPAPHEADEPWLAIRHMLRSYEYAEAYEHLGLTLRTGIYGSTFFMLTGFHGFHVTLGAIMLMCIWLRTMKGHFTPERHFAFEAVAWYWHFVDVVWLGLFIFVYWIYAWSTR